MSNTDATYLSTARLILDIGDAKSDRTGTGTTSLFGLQMRFNLQEEFPLLTTKHVHWHSVVTELLWFLRGDTNIKYLKNNNVRIWNEWATPEGEIGRMYGYQWRNWITEDFGKIDQIADLINGLKHNPDSRRHLVSAWNVVDLPDETLTPQENVEDCQMALAPCHYSFQCYVVDGKLSMLINQRSADFFLGVPFNIASYALLTHMLAQVCDLDVGELIWNGGDCHIYNNHRSQMIEQIQRYLDGKEHPAPRIELDENIRNIDFFNHENIHLIGYRHEPAIKAPIAV